ncbi:response regulator [Patiriisocius marinus]|uniref:Response regulator n=1 Tax=Patiriisocius marinus TaxID=1397112 RepID=A0A5J4J036_9FLAO|nr:response regulator [Patiriisocius marinus]GER59113.1 response regulator [Patiriisocius marinus]
MESKIKFVLLIDDDKATNFYNLMMVSRHEQFSEVSSVTNGQDGLDYLVEAKSGKFKTPDLIFLDINMPGMNGWEFLTEFEKLGSEFTSKIKVIILSTSSDPDEVRKTLENYNAEDFISKPLSLPILNTVYETHF